jgi:uncharacterized membrane protein YdbT with pleckstrin-like domain
MPFSDEQLLPDEKLITVVHQHSLVLLRPIILNVISAIVLAGLAYTLDRYWLLLFLLAPLAYLAWEILVRSRKEYIVTDRRVVKQDGVFSITSFDASLDKINNVFHQQTLLGRVFKYGDVGLETASEQGVTLFQFIPDPVKFKNCIVGQRERRTAQAVGSYPPQNTRDDIPRLLEQLASLRDRNIISAAEFEAKKKTLLEQLK